MLNLKVEYLIRNDNPQYNGMDPCVAQSVKTVGRGRIIEFQPASDPHRIGRSKAIVIDDENGSFFELNLADLREIK